MTDISVEIKKTSEEIMKSFTALQGELQETKKKDALTDAKIDKITDSVTSLLEKHQDLEGRQKGMEAAMNRFGEAREKVGDKEVAKQMSAFNDFVRKGVVNGQKISAEDKIELKSMATDNNTQGGYLVVPQLADFIVGRNFETSPLRQIARVVTTQSDNVFAIIDDDEAGATWQGQGADSTSSTTTPALGKRVINCYKLAAQPTQTVELLQDAIFDVESWLKEKLADKFGRTENTAFVSGTGVNQPTGFTTYSAWSSAGVYERGKIEQINSGATAALTSDGLIGLQASLKEVYQPRATFLMHRTTFGSVLKLKSTSIYYFSVSLLKDGQLQKQLLGKPVMFASDMALEGASNLPVAYGDFSVGYTIVDKAGLDVLRDPYTSKGNVVFYTTKRVGGDVTNFDAIKLQKCSV